MFQPLHSPSYSRALSSTSSLPLDDTRSSNVYPDLDAWNSFQRAGPADSVVGSYCGCGDGCACPSCIIHKPNADRAGLDTSTCAQPDACRGCIDCAASLSYQTSQDPPPNTALSIYDNTYSLPESNASNAIDDWIRQTQNSVSSFQPFPASDLESRSDSLPDSSSSSPIPGALNYPSGMIYDAGAGAQNVLVGRSRSFDDIFSTFSNFDPNIPLDISLFNNDGVGSPSYLTNNFDIETLHNIESTPNDLDLVVAPPSRSASETPSSSAASGTGGDALVNTFSDLGEMSSMSFFYNHAGSGAGGRSSTRSLPDLGYF